MNRYEGNTGRVTRLPEPWDRPRPDPLPPPPPKPFPPQGRPPQGSPPRHPQLPGFDPGKLLPGLREGLETEDLLLLLILYLMYRESGDSDLLIIMGAMFLL